VLRLLRSRDTARLALAAVLGLLSAGAAAQIADWPVTEGAPGGGRFSPLTEITGDNVKQLQVAWTYRHGDFWEGSFPGDGVELPSNDAPSQLGINKAPECCEGG
jgi:glucose dehydrogenase